MKINWLVVGVLLLLGLWGLSATRSAQAATVKTRTPPALRGTYYAYLGNHRWTKLTIQAQTVTFQEPGMKAFRLTTHAKSAAHQLAVVSRHGRLRLNAHVKHLTDNPFPEGGFRLTSRKIHGQSMRVLRGYQPQGYWFDFVRGHRIAQNYHR